jgi:cobalt-zinc-cadmium resistance protein CzcA
MSAFLELALRQRVLVLALACLMAAGGIYSFRTIAIDAFPDVTTVLVQVVTEAQGLSPAEIERFVTFPLELQLMGAPGLTDIRSLSKVGLSMITVVFRDDVDIYLARQVVLERVLEVQDSLPPGARSELVPNSPGLGEVYQFYLEGPHDNDADYKLTETELMERRTLEDWIIRPLLKGRRMWSTSTRSGGSSSSIRSSSTRDFCGNTTSRSTTFLWPWRTTMPTPVATFWKKAQKNTLSGASA